MASYGCCDAPGFQPEYLTLMRRSTVLTLVKRRSTWAITSKTSPTNPNDPFGQPWSTFGQNPTQNPLNTPWPSCFAWNFCRVLQISPKHFKKSQCKSCVFCPGTQLSCWVAFEIWSGNAWKMQVNVLSNCSLAPRKLPTWHAVYAVLVQKKVIHPF
jgi:hypothetical protein